MEPGSPDARRLKEWLDELNGLERQYGRVRREADPMYRTSGEVNARIDLLKEKLARLGVKIDWVDDRYQVVEAPDDAR
ncbi:MAG TPA: hypothetical protein VIL35_10410 [Vicinamibacterales bacterium]